MLSLKKELFNSLAYGLVSALFVNVVWWKGSTPDCPICGTWKLSNPFFDFFYLRIAGPILYGNHVSVALLIIAFFFFLVFETRDYYYAVPAFAITLSCVFIHEVIVQSLSLYVYGVNAIVPQLFSWYMLFLAASFFVTLLLAVKNQQQILALFALFCFLTLFPIMTYYYFSGFHPYTLAQFRIGAQALNFTANLFEIIGWYLPFLGTAIYFHFKRNFSVRKSVRKAE
jgi:hypothetical protein